MMRPRKSSLRKVTCAKTAAFADATGGIARLETKRSASASGRCACRRKSG